MEIQTAFFVMDSKFRMRIEDIKFNSDVEKKFHKAISGLHYGEILEIKTGKLSPTEKLEVKRAIKMSSLYNGISVKVNWSRDDKYIIITHLW